MTQQLPPPMIDLSKIPAPTFIQEINLQEELERLLDVYTEAMQAHDSTFTRPIVSDPAYQVLATIATRYQTQIQAINDTGKSLMLAYAEGSDLEHLGAYFGVYRLDGETDQRLRARIQLAPEGFTVAGSHGAYLYYTLSTSNLVKHATISSPSAGEVVVTVLSNEALEGQPRGTASDQLLKQVHDKLNADEIRPLTDYVKVVSPEIISYQVRANLICYNGPDSEIVINAAKQALQNYIEQHHALGHDINLSAIYHALHQSGVQEVQLLEPTDNIIISDTQAAVCTHTDIQFGGRDV